ncbi:MAG: hypothetical protein D6702_04885, partial [Planctomycetota bacterium]
MTSGILAGAGLIALLDLVVRIPLQVPGFAREAALVAAVGALLGALLARLVAWALPRGPRPAGTGFWLGLAVAGVPLFGSFLPRHSFGLILAPIGLLAARRLGERWQPPVALRRLLAVVPPVGVLIALLLPGLRPPQLPPEEPGPFPAGPDVLLISCDTLRADALEELAGRLPNLERLRRRALWAPYALAASSSTRPSHTTMLSGLPVVQHAVRSNQWRMGEGIELISERFRAAGWRTAAVVSNAMISAGAGFDRGFEVFDETPIVRRHFRNEELAASSFSLDRFLLVARRGTWVGWLGLFGPAAEEWVLHVWKGLPVNRGNGRVTAERAAALLDRLLVGRAPYFLFVHLMDPHTPYAPPAGVPGLPGRAEEVPEAFRVGDWGPGDWTVLNEVGEALASDDEARVAEARAFLEQVRPLYHEEVLFVDRIVGELLDRIERGGRETVVLFTSDHGEQFGEHGLVLHSNSLYEELLRVPFLLAGPGVEPGRLEEPPQHIDVAPTLLALAGLDPSGLPGRVLTAAGGAEPRPHVARFHEWLAVRKDGWKLILEEDGENGFRPVELYRLERDPSEGENLLEEVPPMLPELARLAAAAAAAERGARGAELDTG